ncbi:cysteine peptidase, partial [Entamoeba invadens IP1]
NSWSTGWGEYNNYIRIKTTNLCGIGWRIGDYVYPLNMVVFANTCILDKHCESCNMNTHKCSACKSGYTLNSYNRCVAKTVKVGKLYDCEWTSCNQTKN